MGLRKYEGRRTADIRAEPQADSYSGMGAPEANHPSKWQLAQIASYGVYEQ
jgi:hypothetical protein